MIKKNDYVKLFFKNGLQMEGLVESWSDKKAILKSNADKSFLIINNVTDDIVAVKVIPEFKSNIEIKNDLEMKFEEVKSLPSNDDLRLKTLAQLKQALNDQEKKIISEKIVDHTTAGTSGLNTYGNQFSAFKSSK